MYIKRKPLGEGNLSFGRRKRRYPFVLVLLYLGLLGAAAFVFTQRGRYQEQVMAAMGPEPTPTTPPDTLRVLGDEAAEAGRLEEAITYYQQALVLMPEDTALLYDLSMILTLEGRYDEALTTAETIILLDPEDPHGYAAKSRALNWAGKPSESANAALEAIEADPNFALGHAMLAESYADLGRLRQAAEQAELAITLDPYDPDTRRSYAVVLEYYGSYNAAIQQYQQAIQLAPNRLDLMYGMAWNYRGAGHYDQAEASFLRIALLTPNDPLPLVELGKTYFELRDDSAAQEYLSNAVEMVCEDCPLISVWEAQRDSDISDERPLPDEVFVPAWVRLGMVYFTRRNYESAIDILEEAAAYADANGIEPPIESIYIPGTAFYYLNRCERAVPRGLRALEMYQVKYEENDLVDEVLLNNILGIFVLCRDHTLLETDAYVYRGAGFENGFPLGYAEPDVIVRRPGEEESGDDE